MRKIKEECGIFGVFSNKKFKIAYLVYDGLCSLQHRGEEGCGIAIGGNKIKYYKNIGLVNKVFDQKILDELGDGNLCIGHTRYCTTGENTQQNTQPIIANHINGSLGIAHNGNLVNSYELRKEFELQGSIFHTTNDTEIIAHVITKQRLISSSLQEAVEKSISLLDGAYSLLIMS